MPTIAVQQVEDSEEEGGLSLAGHKDTTMTDIGYEEEEGGGGS